MKIWLAFSGEYEQRSPFAAFTTEALALAETDDVQELDLFDRPSRTEAHWFRWVEVRNGVAVDHFPPRMEPKWPEWVDSFGKALSRGETIHYKANPYNGDDEHDWVVVEGNDPAVVDAEVERRLAELGAVWSAVAVSVATRETLDPRM